jgi:hypothetical protein
LTFLFAFFAMLVGAVLAIVQIKRPQQVTALLAPAAAAFFAAFFFTYDPYYSPSLERYSERQMIGWSWFAVVIALAVGAGVLTRVRPRLGAAPTAAVLCVLLLTTFAVADGH